MPAPHVMAEEEGCGLRFRTAGAMIEAKERCPAKAPAEAKQLCNTTPAWEI
jgi:hypothetical protein